jgi:hypothetical protein
MNGDEKDDKKFGRSKFAAKSKSGFPSSRPAAAAMDLRRIALAIRV